MLAINVRDLFVEGEEIPQYAQAKETGTYQVEQTGEDLAHVEAVDTEQAQEGQQYPGEVVVGAVVVQGAFSQGNTRIEEHSRSCGDSRQACGECPILCILTWIMVSIYQLGKLLFVMNL